MMYIINIQHPDIVIGFFVAHTEITFRKSPSETLVIISLYVKILHVLHNGTQGGEPLVEISFKLFLGDWLATLLIGSQLGEEISTIWAGFHGNLLKGNLSISALFQRNELQTAKMPLTTKLWCFFSVPSYDLVNATESSSDLFA